MAVDRMLVPNPPQSRRDCLRSPSLWLTVEAKDDSNHRCLPSSSVIIRDPLQGWTDVKHTASGSVFEGQGCSFTDSPAVSSLKLRSSFIYLVCFMKTERRNDWKVLVLTLCLTLTWPTSSVLPFQHAWPLILILVIMWALWSTVSCSHR